MSSGNGVADKPQLGAGDVEIVLDGAAVRLRPTLRAGQTLSRLHGGFISAIEKVGNYDLEATTQVIALGLDVRGREAQELPDKVYRSGLVSLAGPVIRYLHVLANGGRPIQDFEEDGADDAEDPADPPTQSV